MVMKTSYHLNSSFKSLAKAKQSIFQTKVYIYRMVSDKTTINLRRQYNFQQTSSRALYKYQMLMTTIPK